MKKITLKAGQGQSNIHDIVGDFDREIVFRGDECYAVVEAAYYGGRGYTTHRTQEAAIAKSNSLGTSHQIIDCEGTCYDLRQTADGYEMVADDKYEIEIA